MEQIFTLKEIESGSLNMEARLTRIYLQRAKDRVEELNFEIMETVKLIANAKSEKFEQVYESLRDAFMEIRNEESQEQNYLETVFLLEEEQSLQSE